MKYYTLETIDNGNTVKINKKFNTRDQAIDYAFVYFERHLFNAELQIEDAFEINDNRHNIEYVFDYHNRFRVNRVMTF